MEALWQPAGYMRNVVERIRSQPLEEARHEDDLIASPWRPHSQPRAWLGNAQDIQLPPMASSGRRVRCRASPRSPPTASLATRRSMRSTNHLRPRGRTGMRWSADEGRVQGADRRQRHALIVDYLAKTYGNEQGPSRRRIAAVPCRRPAKTARLACGAAGARKTGPVGCPYRYDEACMAGARRSDTWLTCPMTTAADRVLAVAARSRVAGRSASTEGSGVASPDAFDRDVKDPADEPTRASCWASTTSSCCATRRTARHRGRTRADPQGPLRSLRAVRQADPFARLLVKATAKYCLEHQAEWERTHPAVPPFTA